MFSFYRLQQYQYILLVGFMLLAFSCKQNNETSKESAFCTEPDFDNYTFCEQQATEKEKAWEAKVVGLMRHIHLFFESIKCNDIPTADFYASKYGLGTLLYLNLTEIETYRVLNYSIYGKTATVNIRLNEKKTTTSCIFK